MLDEMRARLCELAGVARLPSGHKCAPQTIELGGGSKCGRSNRRCGATRYSWCMSWGIFFRWTAISGVWDESTHTAAVGATAGLAGAMGRPGVVQVVGLNPYRLPDDKVTAGFWKLMGGQVSASIANAEAYEQERRRAAAGPGSQG